MKVKLTVQIFNWPLKIHVRHMIENNETWCHTASFAVLVMTSEKLGQGQVEGQIYKLIICR